VVVGHYASALIAKERDRQTPLWFFLLAAMSLDFLLVAFVLGGVEKMDAAPQAGLAPFQTLMIDMRYSHDLLPVAGWALLFAIAAFAWQRRVAAAWWTFFLVVFHEICDLVAGFKHNLWGPDSVEVGWGLYSSAPLSALAIELVLSLACVWWFARRMKISRRRQAGLYALVVFGVAAVLPNALPA
jgi:hypothetical protein